MTALWSIAQQLRQEVAELHFGAPVAHVYNPLEYAELAHRQYCERFAGPGKKRLWLGMNPGPFGMAQTGVPFGEIEAVRDWLGIEAPVKSPAKTHPKRPVEGFACSRSEVSGRRLWGWAKARFGAAERFFQDNFVYNYCPLLFLEESGRNLTPDKLPARETQALYEACDRALRATVVALEVKAIVAIGVFAEKRAKRALTEPIEHFYRVPHPSPASPVANRGWSQAVENALERQSLVL